MTHGDTVTPQPSEPVDIKPVDQAFYAAHLRDALPERIIDIHTHLWRGIEAPAPGLAPTQRRTASWPDRVAASCSAQELDRMHLLMLPGKVVRPLVFGNPVSSEPAESQNAYIAPVARACNFPSLALTRPEWPAEEFERCIEDGGFLGAKVYLTYAPRHLKVSEVRISDFLPPHQLQVLDRRGWLVMLHIPRPARLADKDNLDQLLRIDRDYPNAKVILAHVGRTYCIKDAAGAMETLARTQSLRVDISANTNEEVFHRAIHAVGPGRILFGSDLPITRMRMRRVCENGRYVNLVPKGLYGDVSGDPHMRELAGVEAQELTLFLYEELAAMLRASARAGLTAADIENIFHNNAAVLLASAAPRIGTGRKST